MIPIAGSGWGKVPKNTPYDIKNRGEYGDFSGAGGLNNTNNDMFYRINHSVHD
jgi:hypothetical protein